MYQQHIVFGWTLVISANDRNGEVILHIYCVMSTVGRWYCTPSVHITDNVSHGWSAMKSNSRISVCDHLFLQIVCLYIQPADAPPETLRFGSHRIISYRSTFKRLSFLQISLEKSMRYDVLTLTPPPVLFLLFSSSELLWTNWAPFCNQPWKDVHFQPFWMIFYFVQ